MKHYRTVSAAFDEIQNQDPDTAITPWYLRQIVRSGLIPSVNAGTKKLIALEDIEQFLEAEGRENVWKG